MARPRLINGQLINGQLKTPSPVLTPLKVKLSAMSPNALPKPFLLLCLCVSLTAFASVTAQTSPQTTAQNPVQTAPPKEAVTEPIPADAKLAEIRFEGISNEAIESLVRVLLVSRPGVPVSDIDLSAERNTILGFGAFSEVSLSVENRPVGPVLFVRVKENPPIREVVLQGIPNIAFRQQVRQILLQENQLGAGQIYNTTRAQEAITTLQAIYNAPGVGFPGPIPVTLNVRPVAKAANQGSGEAQTQAVPVTPLNAAAVRLVYTVNQAPPVDTVTFSGETVVPEGELSTLFRNVTASEDFDLSTYLTAVQGVADAYNQRGYRGSGVDRTQTRLADGTLNVVINELRILSLDTTAIGIDQAKFSLKPGDLYNYDTLLSDVTRLAQGRSEDIRLEAQPVGNGVAVVFTAGPPASAGPIERIDLEGNTVFTDAELEQQLALKVGETFTSALATDDFRRLLEFYAQAGYLLVQEPNFNFLDGTYSQRLREVKIAGYQVDLQTDTPRTKDRVITRYLPKVGSVYNQPEVERAILQINALQIARLTQVGTRISHTLVPTDNPAQVIVRFIAQEVPSRTITPSAELTTEGGVSFGADLAVADTNLFGLAHSVSASVNAGTSDLGFLLGGNISYTVPWLDVDFLDFKEVPTSVSAELFSNTTSNQPISSGGRRCAPFGAGADTSTPTPAPDAGTDCESANQVLIGEYTQRDTGFRFSAGRPILPNLSLNVSTRFTQSDYFVERPGEVCDPAAPSSSCSLPYDLAVLYAPQSGFSSFLGSALTYDNRDNPEYPHEGYRFSVSGGVGFGNDFSPDNVQRGYTYEQLEVGASTYVTPFENKSHVFAFRVNAGKQFPEEGLYPDSRLFIIGDTNNQATQIRGYRREDIGPSDSYVATSAEYRYDFGLSTAVTQTIVGIGFVDLGYVPAGDVNLAQGTFLAPLLPSVGVAVQLNIGFGGGLALPPLRFDYGISPKNPTGVFGFRLGFNF